MIQIIIGLLIAGLALVLLVRLVKQVIRLVLTLFVVSVFVGLAAWWYTNHGQDSPPVRDVVEPMRQASEPIREAASPVGEAIEQSAEPMREAVSKSVEPVRSAAGDVARRGLEAAEEAARRGKEFSSQAVEHAQELGRSGAEEAARTADEVTGWVEQEVDKVQDSVKSDEGSKKSGKD
ncbi:MAG: hypothetical protein CL928_06850 [Deltaproteobacteria bacterium]|nr:hypothetical protein [Deltaproteobacteria bacterium]|tara:strand:+ start:50 stop:583 length:534 start_codon:yes stop_codon:yes gene_type:complete